MPGEAMSEEEMQRQLHATSVRLVQCGERGFPFLMGTLQGFVGLLFGLQIVTHAMGYSSGGFVESCTSLLPDHTFSGVDFFPQSGAPPYKVNAIAGEGESIIGFMVDVRKSENVPAMGSFVEFGPGSTGLTCNGIQDSAVTQNSNVPKTFVQVKWQAQENGSSSFFLRATFVDKFTIFWSPVDVTIQTPATTTPSTTTLTSEQSTEQPTTEQPTTEQQTTELPNTDQPSTEQPTTGQTITEQTSTDQPSTEQPTTEQPITEQTSTEQPSTTLGTQSTTILVTQPSTIQLTTTLGTNPSTTQGSTPAPEGPSSTPDLGLSRLYQAQASLICSLTINGHGFLQPPTMKLIRILQWTLSLAAETISLTLLCIWDSGYVPPIALVSVVLFTSLLGYCLLIASLAIGPSHELKKIHDVVSKVVTILHEVLLLAAIFLCLWKIEESDVMKICCDSLLLLGAMAGYAAWRFLFILIFLLIIFLFKTTMAQRNRRGNDYTDSRCRKSTVIIFNLGNIAFAIALIVLMFPCF
ncbi:uncharacterized protein LOC132469461 isoform X2 [Gadus macrocephalus]|uniref:uncharacterized protein LOC132469461 isoform X2 n=1 Tax=Gadus macrocephalus TaxID=80720 RepID=UPI0028CB1681|nr:uncharacterized protein LOC132469461 isoform X2 [Gadus macrocephalus]